MASGAGPPSFWLEGATALDVLLLEGIRCLGLDPHEHLSRMAVTTALDQLIELDPTRPRFWFLRGFAGEPSGDLARAASGPEHVDHYVAGLVAGAVERGDTDSLLETLDTHHEAVMRVFVWQPEPRMTAPALMALVRVRPASAAALAREAPRDYPGADRVLETFRAEATAVRKRGDSDVAALLHDVIRELEETALPGPDLDP